MSVVPPSSKESREKRGWDFTQNGIWFAADTRSLLAKQVADYRITNNLPLGNVEQEIIEFNAAKTSTVIPTRQVVTIRDKVVKWLESKLRIKPVYVDNQEADRRASICAQCPNNIKEWTTGEKCGRCKENALRAMAIILMGRPQHRPLGICSVLEHQNQVAVWLKDDPTSRIVPDFCWRKVDNFDAAKEPASV